MSGGGFSRPAPPAACMSAIMFCIVASVRSNRQHSTTRTTTPIAPHQSLKWSSAGHSIVENGLAGVTATAWLTLDDTEGREVERIAHRDLMAL